MQDTRTIKNLSIPTLKKFGLTIIAMVCMLLSGTVANAQSDPLYSQYMFNKLSFNPAYAGAKGGLSVNALYRAQWTKIDGAPTNIFLSAHSVSKNDKYGYGGQIFRDAIGPTSQYGFYGDYAYRIHIRGNVLALGVQGGISYHKTNWAQLTAYQQGDVNTFNGDKTSEITPNFGLGAHFEAKNLTVGFSAPHLINNKVNKKAQSFLENHYYFDADYKLKINDKIWIVPSMLLKFTGQSAQVDLNLYLVFIKSVWIGAAYRTDKSANFSFQYELKKDRNTFHIGYAYDLGNKAYRTAAAGSHEVLLSYDLAHRPKTSADYLNPTQKK